jgi:hypothetical protein
MNLSQFHKETWQGMAIGLAILTAGCTGWLSWVVSGGRWIAAVPGGILGAVIVGPLIVLLGSVNVKLNFLRGQIRRSHIALREMTNIRPLLNGPPLDYGNWAIDPFFGKVLAQLVHRHQPTHILECGSGTSTVFMAQLQKRVCEGGTVTALEHLDKYAQKSRQIIEEHDLTDTATVVHAPLEECQVDGKTLTWYRVNTERFEGREIEMMVVDGPPQSTGPLARYPAAFVMKPCLADDCVIVMDDGDRDDEQKAARRWADLLGAKLEYTGGPKGAYVLRRES